MMPVKAPKSIPRPDHSPAAAGPVPALIRPTSLKKWSAQLVTIIEGQRAGIFDGWDFGPESLTRADLTRILKKISGCGSVVELRASMDYSTGETSEPAVHAANYCGQHTICPYCAGRVQDRRGSRFRDSIRAMAKKYKCAYMLTATIPPVPTWREDLNRLIDGWQTFRRMGQKRAGRKCERSAGEWGKIGAGIAKIELKRGSGSGLPHCHYHSLVFTNDYLDYRVWAKEEKKKYHVARVPLYQVPFKGKFGPGRGFSLGRKYLPAFFIPMSKISYEWYRATGGTATNFQVNHLKVRQSDLRENRCYSESIFQQSREVLKYATKFDSHPETGAEKLFAQDFINIRGATYNRRLFVTYGEFRKVRGNDFEASGPHISENPLIWETRWRKTEYAPLMPRSRPVFSNMDTSPAVAERIQTLNRIQGQIRRIRFAILKSKKHYQEKGELRPAFYSKRKYAPDGTFEDCPAALEIPAEVAQYPWDSGYWEDWLDSEMERGRWLYNAAKEDLTLQTLERMDGTREEREAARAAAARAWYQSQAYEDHTAQLFIRTLNGLDEVPAASSPPH